MINFKNISIALFVMVVLITGALLLVVKSKTFQFYGGMINRIETSDKVVALTFDDGPSKKYTTYVLDVLEAEDIKATFFLTGKEMKANKAEALNIHNAGHEIANHSYSHGRLVLKSRDEVITEVERTDNIIRELGFTGEIWFRPPFGQTLFNTPAYLKSKNRPTIMWDSHIDSYKNTKSAEQLIQQALDQVKPGSIVLLHVMYESREKERIALPTFIKKLKQQGYRFITVGEMMSIKKEVLN